MKTKITVDFSTTNDLTEEEQKHLTYIKKYHPELEKYFLQHIYQARYGIMKRLIRALVKEKLIDSNHIKWSEREEALTFQLSAQKMIHIPISLLEEQSWGIHREIFYVTEAKKISIRDPGKLLSLLSQYKMIQLPTNIFLLERFQKEVENSTANYAMALTGAKKMELERRKEVSFSSIHTTFDLIEKKRKEDASFSPFVFFEQSVIDGHTMHPCSKTKMGLSVSDLLTYSPEWGNVQELHLVAVNKKWCHITSIRGKSPGEILLEEYAGLSKMITSELNRKGVVPNEYEVIPVHSWQYKYTLPKYYLSFIKKQIIIPITGYSIPVAPLVSFRTMAPIQERNEQKHHIKTAVNIQMTSAVRTVSPASTKNGPAISNILRKILEKENHFNHRFMVLEEPSAIHFDIGDHTIKEEQEILLEKNLAAILRENPENYVQNEEIIMPAVALIARSPVNGKYIGLELIEKYKLEKNFTSLPKAALAFIKQYAEISLPGFLTLLCRYGISLEGHLQNSMAVFKNGEPVRIIYRDYGGVRIIKEKLSNNGLEKESSFLVSPIITNHVTQLRSVFTHSVIYNHLSVLIRYISRQLKMSESYLWESVRDVLKETFEKLKKDDQIKSAVVELEQLLFEQPFLETKALVSMRLLDESAESTFAKITNPLCENREENKNEYTTYIQS